jgi:hypothetical protein
VFQIVMGYEDQNDATALRTFDWFAYPYFDPCVDCAEFTPFAASLRVTRGGEFASDATSYLAPDLPEQECPAVDAFGRNPLIGFRCARAP